MRSRVSIPTGALFVSAVLAVLYVLVILASLLLVGWATAGSWQAAFLGIGWHTVVGLEIGLLAVVMAGCALAWVFVPAYTTVRRRLRGPARAPARAAPPRWPSAASWPVRVLGICFVLPALALVVLRAGAAVGPLGAASEAAGANRPGAGGHVSPVNLGAVINTAQREAEPSFTADGRTMVFNCQSGDLCVSHLTGSWEEGSWTPPQRLAAPISTEYEEVEPLINAAGDKLYFMSTRPGGRLQAIPLLSPFVNVLRVVNTLATARLGRSLWGGLGLSDVYVSYRVDGVWSAPQNLNDAAGEPHLNTPFADHCLFFSADGSEAFWTSTRPGGFGADDIWTSRRIDGTWTEPENLGPTINGPGSEHTSIPTPDGRALYVTATRTAGFGGEDIYVTTRAADSGGTWGPLHNLGPLVNGPGDDRCPAWTPDRKIFLFDAVRAGGLGARDIWWVYFEDVPGYPSAGVPAGSASAARLPRHE
jgi:hypothetical protein